MKIKRAKISDAETLTILTIRSKSYWNYTEKQITEWKPELTISPSYLKAYKVRVLYINREIRGYYAYRKISDEIAELDNLFIDPDYIGLGYGQYLLLDLFRVLKKKRMKKIILHSDPNAQGFYEKYGFQVAGEIESSIAGRYLPILELEFSLL